jgi:hypothetical protein
MAFLGPLITIGSSLFGGLFGVAAPSPTQAADVSKKGTQAANKLMGICANDPQTAPTCAPVLSVFDKLGNTDEKKRSSCISAYGQCIKEAGDAEKEKGKGDDDPWPSAFDDIYAAVKKKADEEDPCKQLLDLMDQVKKERDSDGKDKYAQKVVKDSKWLQNKGGKKGDDDDDGTGYADVSDSGKFEYCLWSELRIT